MKSQQQKSGTFQKVGECLYRYSNGVYYARLKTKSKEIRRSLRTTDRALAQRNLAALKQQAREIDWSQGKLTLKELCQLYLRTIWHQRPKTVERKTAIVKNILRDWPTGNLTRIDKIKPSDVDLWLSNYEFGPASRNLYISCIKEVFALAVRDRVIATSPATHLLSARRETRIWPTPTFEQFKAIIADVRSQRFNADAGDSADLLEFMGLAGLGQAEAGSLSRSDINLEEDRIITFRHKTSTGFAIPIFGQVKPLLERLCQGKTNGDPIFRVRDAKRALASACQRLGLPPFSQRSLRRMFITRALELGVDVPVVAQWQGHKDGGKLILQTYSHVRPIHSDRMAQLMVDEAPQNTISMNLLPRAGRRAQ